MDLGRELVPSLGRGGWSQVCRGHLFSSRAARNGEVMGRDEKITALFPYPPALGQGRREKQEALTGSSSAAFILFSILPGNRNRNLWGFVPSWLCSLCSLTAKGAGLGLDYDDMKCPISGDQERIQKDSFPNPSTALIKNPTHPFQLSSPNSPPNVLVSPLPLLSPSFVCLAYAHCHILTSIHTGFKKHGSPRETPHPTHSLPFSPQHQHRAELCTCYWDVLEMAPIMMCYR